MATAKKSKEEVHYRKAIGRLRRCATCAYMNADGTCDKIRGIVTKPMLCDLFKAMGK